MKTLTKIVANRLQELDRKPAEAERIGGLRKSFVNDILADRKDSVQARNLAGLARALDWTEEQLQSALLQSSSPATLAVLNVTDLPADVPVMGVAAASVAGAFIMESDPVERVRRPPGVATARNIYALYVQGESMSPRYRAGDLIFVSPDRPPRGGDDVIIQTRSHDQAPVESWLKTYIKSTEAEVVAIQLNPSAEIKFRAANVIAMHRVLSMRELFSV